VVDARVDDVQAYAAFATNNGMRITHVIDTHVHADHRSGGRELAQRTGAQYCLHESADVAFPFIPLRDVDTIELGHTRLKVLHTPGHSPESLHDTLLTLPGDLEIYPGHFSGSLCGVGLSGKPTSTIAFERRWNPMLSLDRDAFIDAVGNVPAKPHEMEQILAFNRGGSEVGA